MAIVPNLLAICPDIDPNMIDPVTVEIFDRYKWGLKYLKVQFNPAIGQGIIQTSHDLEDIFIAFCGWTLGLIQRGERITGQRSSNNLLQALGEGWQPTENQRMVLQRHSHILASLEQKMWHQAGVMLGVEVRNANLFSLGEDGTFAPEEAQNIDPEKLRALKQYQRYLWELYDDREAPSDGD